MEKDKKQIDKKVEVKKEDLEDKKKPEEPPKTPQVMKKGDYIVHILIEEIRNLVGKENTDLVIPTVKVSCLKKEKRTTKLKQGCTSYTFTEHFYFEKNNMSNEELDSEKIIIEVIDGNNTDREDYIGIYEFDFTFIYNNKDHSVHNFWIALANPESQDITKVRGFLKLSASVLNENDPRIELNYKSTDDPNAMCVIPPQVKMEYRQVSIYILKGEQFPDMDYIFSASKKNKECNGFVHVKYLGTDVKTSVKDQKGDTIIWNEVLDIPVSIPVVSQKIVIQVWDKDPTSNDIIGSFEIQVDDILANKYEKLQYIPIYGAPVGRIGKYTDKMNANSEIGSIWKGRILMKVTHGKTDTPKKAMRTIDDKQFLEESTKLGKPNRWFFDIFLFEACFLPTESGTYSIHFAMEESIREFSTQKANKRNIYFNYNKTLLHQTLTGRIEDVPDLFIYLVNDSGVNICFQRISVDTFLNNEDVLIIKLLPDPSIGKLEEFVYSGIVKVRIKLKGNELNIPMSVDNNVAVNDSMESDGGLESHIQKRKHNVKQEKLKRENTIKPVEDKARGYMIAANVHMSRYLVAGDSDGTSDPFVIMRIGDKEKKTTTRYDTVNCIWNECVIFENVELNISDKSTWPTIFLQVMDEDHLRNDMLAYNYIWLSDSAFAINQLPILTPKWHQLHLPISNRPQGQILCSFYILDMKQTELTSQARKMTITPETNLYTVEINILGLRDLKPLSIMPVKKPFIAFDLNSINITGQEDCNLKIIKTQPKNIGRNPTINTVIKFDVNLPKDEVFMPEMQCVVYDYILAGLINQMLGVFHIDLKKIIKDGLDEINKNMKMTNMKLGMFLVGEQGIGVISKENTPVIGDINLIKLENINIDKEILNKSVNSHNQKNNVNNDNNYNYIDNNNIKKTRIPNPQNLSNNEKIELVNINVNTENHQLLEKNLDKEKPNNKYDLPNQINLNQEVYPNLNVMDPINFVIKPIYKLYNLPGNKPGSKNYKEFEIEDESKMPSLDHYMPVGYNKLKIDDKKHYRRFFNCNLEDSKELALESPFYKIPLKRGKFVDQSEETGIFEALRDKGSKIIKRFKKGGEDVNSANKEMEDQANKFYDTKSYGDFKGLMRIVEKDKLTQYFDCVETIKKKGNTALLKDFKFLTDFEDISKRILVEKECVVRVYILNLGELAKKDMLSESDPFLKIYLGGQEVNESDNAKDDSANCSWCKYYDFTTTLPGDGNLLIEVWDYDPLFSDELIGSTTIDIEDRFFDYKWKSLNDKPIEKRILNHPDIEGPQGWMTLWVEVFEKKDRALVKKWDISPPPTTDLEMRLIVWDTEETPCMDDEGMSDYYVMAFIDSNQKQSTDVHYRCEEGNNASFNWRIVMPISVPRNNTKLNLQLMDNDIFSADDYVSGSVLEMGRLINDVYALDIPIKFTESFWLGLNEANKDNPVIEFAGNSDSKQKEKDKFWLQLYKPGNNGTEKGGRVLLSLEILPKWKAQICTVGLGREEPNTNPYLPAPLGRFQWSLNPFKILNQMVGAQYRRRFYCALCCALCVFYLIFVLPFTLLHISGEAVNPFNYVNKNTST